MNIQNPLFSPQINLMKSLEQNYFYLSSIYSTKCQTPITSTKQCKCYCCAKATSQLKPQIFLNPEVEQIENLKKQFNSSLSFSGSPPTPLCQWVEFLNLISQCFPKIPNIPILDTIVFKKGEVNYMLRYLRTLKLDRVECREYRKVILERKRELDIEYMKKQYVHENPSFVFSSLDHIGQIIIRGFTNKIEQVIPQQRKTCIIKLSSSPSPFIISQKQISKNINLTTNKRFKESQIQYLQIFPIPSTYQQSFKTLSITFNRNKDTLKPLWRQAEFYFSLWQKPSDTLQNSQQQFLSSISSKEQYLLYTTYKLIIHIHSITEIRIDSMIAEYYVDRFDNHYLKNVRHLCWKNLKDMVEVLKVVEKVQDIKKEDYIVLDKKMGEYFEGFKEKLEWFRDVDRKNEEVEKEDVEESEKVIRQIKGQIESKKIKKIINKIK